MFGKPAMIDQGIRGRKWWALLLAVMTAAVIAGGCTPSAEYSTAALDSIGFSASGQADANAPRLAVVFTENTKKAIRLIEETRSVASMGGLNFAFNYEEIDANYLTRRINEALTRHFSKVQVFPRLTEVPSGAFDVIMALDVQVNFGKTAFSSTTVALAGAINGADGKPLDRITGEGSMTLGYPAVSYHFQPVTNQAISMFAGNLDRSPALSYYAAKQPGKPSGAAVSSETTATSGSRPSGTAVVAPAAAAQPRPVVAEPPAAAQPRPVIAASAAVARPRPAGATLPAVTPATTQTAGKEEAASSGAQSPASPAAGWAVVVGIGQYRSAGENGLQNLAFADDDAVAFATVLNGLGWRDSHIRLLVNEQATLRNIVIALESWLTKAGPNDQIVLFWAGHGYADPEDPEKVYFACYDTDLAIPATGYRMDKVRTALQERNARNVLVFADTCHAGKLITRGDARSISIVPNITRMREQNAIPKGWIFMVGADTDRQAVEHSSWTNGAFTHCLLRGLTNDADGFQSAGKKDGTVTMGELKDYLSAVMPDETLKVLGAAKHPVITTSTGDPDIWNISLQRSF